MVQSDTERQDLGQSLTDASYRLGYRLAFAGLRVWWWLRRPEATGAAVALWSGDRLLLVQTSYRRGWELPGGGVRAGESPLAAALREAREEVGIALEPARLSSPLVIEDYFEHRHDRVHLYESELGPAVAPTVDRREIVAARYFDAGERPRVAMTPLVRRYLRRRESLAAPGAAR
ncbi:MAG TPA: NUDIX hydrolase [Stellaceae bacterium]|nr:NUDIX hydrolase [Stellaceae bacterium]